MNGSEAKQAEYYKTISKLFFEKNFGQTTKSEIELLMFHIYMDQLGEEARRLSDYKIGLRLGITAQRVRNLRVRDYLSFGQEVKWKEELEKMIDSARYDDPYIIVDMPDPNVLNAIKNYLEENGKYVITQRNPRLLVMRVEYFLDLIIEIDNNGRDKVFEVLKNKIRKDNKGNEIDLHPVKNSCKDILEIVGNVTTIAATLSGIISPQNYIGKTVLNLFTK